MMGWGVGGGTIALHASTNQPSETENGAEFCKASETEQRKPCYEADGGERKVDINLR